ncbi:MAG TPA: AI-2E family transporter [Chloroflexota bacterium]|nr:AI-2E family transporter [Chloroflexota bacterium]
MSWTRAGAKITIGVVAVLLALYVGYLIRPVIVIFLVSIIFAQAISPLVLRLRRLGARRAPAVLSIYLLIALAIAGLGWFLVQAIASQVGTLLQGLPEMQQKLSAVAQQLPGPIQGIANQMLSSASQPQLPAGAAAAVPGILDTVRAVFEAIFAVFSVFVVTFYWISERLAIRRAFLRLLPEQHRERGLQIWGDVEDKLGDWVRGELLVMLCIGGAFAVGLLGLRVKFALLLAVFAAVVEIVPMIGPYIGTAAAVLVALTQSFQLALIVAAFGAVVQILENNILVPRIMGRSTGVSPLTVILGILIGATLAGIAGALLAVPVAAAMQVLLVDLEVLSGNADIPPAVAESAETREEVRTQT